MIGSGMQRRNLPLRLGPSKAKYSRHRGIDGCNPGPGGSGAASFSKSAATSAHQLVAAVAKPAGTVSQICHAFAETGGHEKTRRPAELRTGGHWRNRRDTGGYDVRRVRDRAPEGTRRLDSQCVRHWQPSANVSGFYLRLFTLRGRRWTGATSKTRSSKSSGGGCPRASFNMFISLAPSLRRASGADPLAYSNAGGKPWH